MFAIYTPNGRTFSGPLERIRSVDKPQAINAIRQQQETDDILTFGNTGYRSTPKAIETYIDSIEQPNSKEMVFHAFQVMTSPVQVLASSCSLETAINKFEQFSFQAFPIINEQYRLVGFISRQQVYEYVLKHKNNKGYDKAASILSLFLHEGSKVYAAEPVTDVRRIAALMLDHELHIVPIIESSGCIVGIISRTNIIKAVMTEPPLSLWC